MFVGKIKLVINRYKDYLKSFADIKLDHIIGYIIKVIRMQ